MKGYTMKPKMKQDEIDYCNLTNKVDSMIADTNTKMTDLIDEYNTKYKDNDEVYKIETCDLDSLFDQLAEYIEDHQ
jgi:hypothetical protein